MWYRCSGGGREQRANLLRRENRAAYYIRIGFGRGVIVMCMPGPEGSAYFVPAGHNVDRARTRESPLLSFPFAAIPASGAAGASTRLLEQRSGGARNVLESNRTEQDSAKPARDNH